jgi:molybdate transport system substrate-binding protein
VTRRVQAALLTLALLAGPMLAGCAANADGGLTVFAAASLRDALTALQKAYGPLTTSLGGSNALRVQIEQGAPADVFLSADAAEAQQLDAAGRVDGATVDFAHNHVVLVTPPHGSRVGSWTDLAEPGVKLIGAVADVPIQRYADGLVALLAREPEAPAGYADAVARNVVSREDNVATVLARIQLGEGDAAFVYASDAMAGTVTTLPLPEDVNVAATYVGAAVKGGNTSAAHRFLDWLRDRDAQAVLARYGFSAR